MPMPDGPRYEAVVESAPVGIALLDVDGTVRAVNARARLTLHPDRPATDAGLVGQPWSRALPYLLDTGFESVFLSARDAEPGSQRLLRLAAPTGLHRIRLVRGAGDSIAVFQEDLGGADGHQTAAQATHPDAQWPAQEPEEGVDRQPFGSVASFDHDYRYLMVTGRGWSALGIDPRSLEGKTLHELWPEDLAQSLIQLADVGLAGYEAVQRVSHEGRTYQVWTGPLPPDAEGCCRGVFVSHEVTVQVERARQIQLLERATEAAHLGVTLVDLEQPDQPLVYASPGFLQLTGYGPSEILGRNCRFLQGPATDATSVREIRVAIEEGRPTTQTLLNYRKDGTPFWNRLSLSPFSEGRGRITHFVGIQEDVTEIREAQVERERSWRLVELGTLAGSIAHDFNNFLMEIRGRVALCEGDEELDWRNELQGIDEAAARGSALVAQLLGYARRSADAEPESGPPSTLLREALRNVLRILDASVTVSLDHPEEPVPLAIDQLRLEQILLNLVKNAADAMPEGGQLHIALQLATDGDWAFITVEDSGAGMTEEVRERAFQPFFSTKGSAGTGLGLSSTANILQRLGGSIEVASEPGLGTTFTLRVPTAGHHQPRDPRRTEPRTRAQVPSLEGLRILVADDQPGIRSVLSRLLARVGLAVSTAADGREALTMIETAAPPFDVILVDRDMPSLTGDRLLWAVARREVGVEKLPWMILMSGELSLTAVDLPPGVVRVQKPFEMPDVVAIPQTLITGEEPAE